jgi:hypothetical protein
MIIEAKDVEYADKLTRKTFRQSLVLHCCWHLRHNHSELRWKKPAEVWRIAQEQPKYYELLLEEMSRHCYFLSFHDHPNPVIGATKGAWEAIKSNATLSPTAHFSENAEKAITKLLMQELPAQDKALVYAR